MTPERRRQFAWASYDWGNSAFATTVVAGLFPIFFEQYWASNLDSASRTFWLGVASSVSSTVRTPSRVEAESTWEDAKPAG